MSPFPALIRTSSPGGETRFTLGDPLVDSYLAFVAGRARPNTLRAVAFDLKAFFTVVDKDPVEVVAADVFGFQSGTGQMHEQDIAIAFSDQTGRHERVRLRSRRGRGGRGG